MIAPVTDPSYDEACKACLTVRRARRGVKFAYFVLGSLGVIAEVWAVVHSRPWMATIIAMVAVFGVTALTERLREHDKTGVRRPLLGFLNLRRRSWGFLAMGGVLAYVAYREAQIWSTLYTPEWLHRWHISWWHLRYDAPRSGFWMVTALVVVLVYTAFIFRRGEAKNYQDYLVFNSLGKIAHDFVAVPVSFVTVVCAVPVLVCTNWPVLLDQPRRDIVFSPSGAIFFLILGWVLLGMFDLWRLKGSFICPMRRESVHVQGTPSGRAYQPPIFPALSPKQFKQRQRLEKRRSVPAYPTPN